MTNEDAKFTARIRALLEQAVAGLDPTDRAERIAWCEEHDQHGVTMHPNGDDDLVEFRWGGRTLAMVPNEVLFGEYPLPAPEFIGEVPDTVPAELQSAVSPLTPNQRSILFTLPSEPGPKRPAAQTPRQPRTRSTACPLASAAMPATSSSKSTAKCSSAHRASGSPVSTVRELSAGARYADHSSVSEGRQELPRGSQPGHPVTMRRMQVPLARQVTS